MPVGPAREQLHELISILRELRNAGPRDQSFKQWRQVTLTLLQRIWPSEPARAASFRRILFSAPTARADAGATREYFERGCSEATAYLEGLASELESGLGLRPPPAAAPAPPPAPEAREPEAPATPQDLWQGRREVTFRPTRPFEPARLPDPVEDAPVEEPAAAEPFEPEPPARPARPQFDPRTTFADFAQQPAAPDAPPSSHAAPPVSQAPSSKTKARLKDMLGFGDEPAPAHAVPPPPPPPPPPIAAAPPPPPPVAFVPPPPVAAPTPPPIAAVPPPRPMAPPPPPIAMPAAAWPPPSVRPRPVPEPEPVDEVEDEDDFEAPEVEVSDIEEAAPEAEPSRPARRTAPTLAAREVLSMAGLVAELGVPAQRRAIVRAALIDLGRQMDSPPVHWSAIRQALSFMLDYPQIARRVLPLLMPYLEEAA
jgi:hypothetical protein